MGRHRSHPTGTGKACQGHSLKDFAASGCKGREDSLRDRTSREKIMKNKIRSHIASEHGCHRAVDFRSWNYAVMKRYLRHLWIWSRPLSLIIVFFFSTVTQEATEIVIPQRDPKSLVQNLMMDEANNLPDSTQTYIEGDFFSTLEVCFQPPGYSFNLKKVPPFLSELQA